MHHHVDQRSAHCGLEQPHPSGTGLGPPRFTADRIPDHGRRHEHAQGADRGPAVHLSLDQPPHRHAHGQPVQHGRKRERRAGIRGKCGQGGPVQRGVDRKTGETGQQGPAVGFPAGLPSGLLDRNRQHEPNREDEEDTPIPLSYRRRHEFQKISPGSLPLPDPRARPPACAAAWPRHRGAAPLAVPAAARPPAPRERQSDRACQGCDVHYTLTDSVRNLLRIRQDSQGSRADATSGLRKPPPRGGLLSPANPAAAPRPLPARREAPVRLALGVGLQLAALNIAAVMLIPMVVMRAAGMTDAYLSWASLPR